jgi:hypothetical protein
VWPFAGSKALEFNADLHALIPSPVFKGWRVKGQRWGREMWPSRATVFSSGWVDLAAATVFSCQIRFQIRNNIPGVR